MSEMRDAILLAALQMEKHPETFNFRIGHVPKGAGKLNECGTPGCALGWIATFWNALKGSGLDAYWQVAQEAGFELGVGVMKDSYPESGPGFMNDASWKPRLVKVAMFYNRMDAVCASFPGNSGWEWRDSASVCAATLRGYADLYHPEEMKVGKVEPEAVSMFETRVEELEPALA